jgi:protein-tyrosine phosphatase
MIDIHCHILPGLDDGPKAVSDSLELARAAVREGIQIIIATPHHHNGQFINEKKDILQAIDKFNKLLIEQDIPLEVLPGQETRINGELLSELKQGKILTQNDKQTHLFIELPSGHVPRYLDSVLYEVQLQGITPVIVHPERNRELIANPDLLYGLVAKGVLTQVTAASVAGSFGKKIKKFSLNLIASNLTHFIASDAHNTVSRTFKLNEAFNVIAKEFGMDKVYFLKENAELLSLGHATMWEPPQQLKQKKFLGIF